MLTRALVAVTLTVGIGGVIAAQTTPPRSPAGPVTLFQNVRIFDGRGRTLSGPMNVLVRWYTPAEALVMATGTNAQLLALSGERNPYPGKLGVVEVGALADLLLVDGDPIANIRLIEDPARNFVVIMKDGRIYKNLLR
jgi:cytosine/adenosine deaminase-related metal-dependent hydrolase